MTVETKNGFMTIYSSIRKQIEEQQIAPGSLLPTESQMAELWNVSRPTITKVYNRLQDDGFVVKRQGYGTEVLRRREGGVPRIGLLLPGAGESEIFGAINDRLMEMGSTGEYEFLCDGSSVSNAKIRSMFIDACVDDYIAKGVDGIIFSPLERVENADELNRRICDKISLAGIPIVLIDRDIVHFPDRSAFDLVSLDNYSSAFSMARHMIDAGCRSVYFFYRPQSANSIEQRCSAVNDAARRSGLEFTADNVLCAEPGDMVFLSGVHFPEKSGIVCANDATAAILMTSLDELGLKVGKDVLVCGFDDMVYGKHLKTPLTSLRQPCEDIATVAVEMMVRRLANPRAVTLTTILPGSIRKRESTRFADDVTK